MTARLPKSWWGWGGGRWTCYAEVVLSLGLLLEGEKDVFEWSGIFLALK